MESGVKSALRADLYIIAKADLSGIYENAVIIGKEPITGFHIAAEAEEDRRLYIRITA